MSSTLLTIIVAAGLVAFFVASFSIGLIFKGRVPKAGMGDSLRRRGIECAVQQERKALGYAEKPCTTNEPDCAACDKTSCKTDCRE
jgi:hypothetical protein